MRTYDSLGWSAWGWTSIIGLDVSGVREVITPFGENVIALCELFNGNEAIYQSPNSGKTWTKQLEVEEIYDITSVGWNWTLASTSAGWYSSLKAGTAWELVAAAGEGVPVGKSVVFVAPNHLFSHAGDAIWLSENRGAAWSEVCDLSAIPGYSAPLSKYSSIDGYYGRVIATCGRGMVETLNRGDTWAAIDLATIIRSWSAISAEQPIWRQVAFWDTLDATDPTKSRWLISAILTKSNIIRTFVGRGAGTFSPTVDMALSERHRLNVTSTRRMGADITDLSLMISGDRRVDGELRHALTISSDGVTFNDVLAGDTNSTPHPSSDILDFAHGELQRLR